MAEVQISQKSRLEIIDETRNCFVEEMKQNDLMSKKHKNNNLFMFLLSLDMFQLLL